MSTQRSRRVSIGLRVWLTCAGMVLLTASFPARARQAVGCGDTIVGDLRLESDLSCSGAGLIVGADGIHVDLNGHAITGSGAGIGLDVVGRANIAVRGGTIRGFFTGIRSLNATDIEIKGMWFIANVDGVDLQSGSGRFSIKDNEFVGNTSRGIMMRGGTFDIEAKSNTVDGNRVGILLNGVVGATVKENTIWRHGLAGIRFGVESSANLVAENTIVSNPIGIDFVPGPNGGSMGNTLRENQLLSNVCGLSGPLGGNTFTQNHFSGNTTDVCAP